MCKPCFWISVYRAFKIKPAFSPQIFPLFTGTFVQPKDSGGGGKFIEIGVATKLISFGFPVAFLSPRGSKICL